MTCNVSAHLLRGGALGASAEAYAADGMTVVTLEDALIRPLGVMTSEGYSGIWRVPSVCIVFLFFHFYSVFTSRFRTSTTPLVPPPHLYLFPQFL